MLAMMEGFAYVTVRYILKQPRVHQYDRTLGWRLIPELDVRRYTKEGTYNIKTNRYGQRSEFDENASPTYRILILGDSYAFGQGVNVEDRFDRFLESIDAPDPVQIINAGVVGYSSDQEFLYLEKEGTRFKPDMVILMTYPNDFEDIVENIHYGSIRSKPRFILRGEDLVLTNVPIPLWSYFRDRSYLIQAAFTILMPLRHPEHQADTSEAINLFIALRTEMAELCKVLNIVFINVLFSGKDTVGDKSKEVWKKGLTDKIKGITIIDLDELLLAVYQGDVKDLFFKTHNHWNQKGNALVGQIIKEEIDNILYTPNH